MKAGGERSARKHTLEFGGKRLKPRNAATRWIDLERVAHRAIEALLLQCFGNPCREDVDLALRDAVALPYHVTEHDQDHRRNAPQKPCDTLLDPSHVVELLAFLARARGFRFLAGIEEGTLQFCDLRRLGLACSGP